MPTKPRFLTSALYKFVDLPDYGQLRAPLLAVCAQGQVKGTLLLASEGVNGTIAGPPDGVAAVLAWLRRDPRLSDLEDRQSWTDTAPFLRLKVRLKAEIVSMHIPGISPVAMAGQYVEPHDWNRLIDDPQVVVVDARNDYEVAIGSFKGAIDPQTRTFSELPSWLARESLPGGRLASRSGQRPKVAMFCTGGIRCEKSTAYLRQQGFDQVFHLRGGILKYLEAVAPTESRWQGECFVFDERVSVAQGLRPGDLELCRSCRRPVSAAQKASPEYREGVSCPACFDTTSESRKQGFAERQRQVLLARTHRTVHVGATLLPKASDREPPKLNDIPSHVSQLLDAAPQRRRLIGVTGVPGSGKSVFAAQLADALNWTQGSLIASVVGVDGFHLSRHALARFPDPDAALARRGAPWTFDAAALARQLRLLRSPETLATTAIVAWPGFEHSVGDPIPDALAVPASARVVFVEGLYLLHRCDGWQLDGLLDECWFLDTPADVAEARLVQRHMASWEITADAARARIASNDHLNGLLVLSGRSRADWLVRS